MNARQGCRPHSLHLGLVVFLVVAAPPAEDLAAASIQGRPPESWASAGVRQIWRASVPLNNVNHIRSWYLVDEYLYGFGTDGKVRAIDAMTGEHVWTQQMVDPLSDMFPPVSWQAGDVRGILFTVRDMLLFLNPATGTQLHRPEIVEGGKTEPRPVGPIHLMSGSMTSAVASELVVFQAAPRKRVREYSIERDIQIYQVSIHQQIFLAPIYVPARDLVVMADEVGTLAGLGGAGKETLWTAKVRGGPVGWLAADADRLYLATDEPRVHALDLSNGEERLEGYPQGYLLPGAPAEGPLVTKASVYVALEKRGVQRVGKELKWPNWLVTDARRFLAEWPDRVVLQRMDGKIMFVRPETGELLGLVDMGPGLEGLSNPRNDAIILASRRGEVCCLRPVGVEPLAATDFRPAASQPATAPAEAVVSVPEETPEEKPAEETPPEDANAAAPAEEAGPKLSPVEALIADPLKSRR